MSEDLELVAKMGSIQYYQSKWKWRQTPLTETAITTKGRWVSDTEVETSDHCVAGILTAVLEALVEKMK